MVLVALFLPFSQNKVIITQQEGATFHMLAFIFSHINFINCIIKSFAVIPFPSSIQVYFTHLFPLYQNHHFVYNRVESSTLCILYTEFNSIKWRRMRMHCLCDNPRLCFFYSLNFISFFITFHLLRFFYAKFLFFPHSST